jgi:RHS repeat-associated protein
MRILKAAITTLVLLGTAATARAQVVEYYHMDGLGSVRAVSAQNGTLVERHDYLPFGEECTTGPCAANPGAGAGQARKFTGKERDQETGLDYFGARHYGAKIARFTAVDPVYTWRENLVNPQLWNRYGYARNNPLRYVDPDGRASKKAEAVQLFWNRMKHIIQRHIKKDQEEGASKFITNNPQDVKKLADRAVRGADEFSVQQDGRRVYQKMFNKEIGTEGEQGIRVITEPVAQNKEKVITAHPIRDFLIGLIPGMAIVESGETAVELGGAGADHIQGRVREGNMGVHMRQRDEALRQASEQQ